MAYLVHPPPPSRPFVSPLGWQPIPGSFSPFSSLTSPHAALDSPFRITSPKSPFPSLPLTGRQSPIEGLSAISPSKTNGSFKRPRRKRCGQCTGCLRKENCGKCVVCTNPSQTTQCCKLRRCEVLLQRPSSLGPSEINVSYPPSEGLTPVCEEEESVEASTPKISVLQEELSLVPRKRRRNGICKPTIKEPPSCGCPGDDDGHFYTHLGAGATPEDLRRQLELRFKATREELRMIEITYTGMEAKTAEGCPTAEWIIRRKSKEEKFLVLYRHHLGHTCNEQYTAVSIVYWDALDHGKAGYIYKKLTEILPPYGQPTQRKCEYNESKSCSCQGYGSEGGGASYSFGCSWSVYYNGCKFARSKTPRKFRLTVQEKEEELEEDIQKLATEVAPIYKWLAPQAYQNQIGTQSAGRECRLGKGEEKPFSGMTCCMDFCAHSHYDKHNMADGGATIVLTILKQGVNAEEYAKNPREQLHCLPLYKLKEPPSKSEPGIEVRPVESSAPPAATFGSLHSGRPEQLPVTAPLPVLPPGHKLPMNGLKALTNHQASTPNGEEKQELIEVKPNLTQLATSTPVSTGNGGGHAIPKSFADSATRHFNQISPPRNANGFRLNGFVPPHDSSTDSDSDCCVVMDSPPTPPSSRKNLFTGGMPKAEPLTPTPTPTPTDTVPRLNGFHNGHHMSHLPNGFTRSGFSTPPPPNPFSNPPQAHTPTLDLGEPISHPFDHILTPGTPLGLPMDGLTPSTGSPMTSDVDTPEKKSTPEKRVGQLPRTHLPTPLPAKNERLCAVPGGVALALTHASVLVECAKKELHATTPIRHPNKAQPTRLSMVFYQHKHLRRRFHGYFEEEEKQKQRQEEQLRRKLLEVEQQQQGQFGLFSPFGGPGVPLPLRNNGKLINSVPGIRIPPTYRPGMADSESGDTSNCSMGVDYSDTVESMLLELEENSDFSDEEDEEEEVGNSSQIMKTIVEEESQLMEMDQPYFLELPLQRVDREDPAFRLTRLAYPCPLVSQRTHSTTTVSYSNVKPQDIISGNYTIKS